MKSLEYKIDLGLLKKYRVVYQKNLGSTEDSVGIMSQLDKCLKFISVRGGGIKTTVHYTK